MRQVHPIPPLYDENCRVLILGSFPSVKSRQEAFFYAHPQNRFWRVLANVFQAPVPQTVSEKRNFVLKNGIGLWDVISSCTVTGSADSSIAEALPNDLSPILERCPSVRIFTNGKTAFSYYNKLIYPQTHREAICLPSTSPANASFSLERLCDAWQAIRL